MSSRTRPAASAAIAGLLVAGCAGAFAPPPAYESTIKRYYEAHASERSGQCLAPYIDGFTTVEVVEDTPERLVVEAGYLYRDRVKDRSDSLSGRGIRECSGYNHRSFVLTGSEDSLQVTEMSGPRRN
ncbi:MAG: hypothetical protein ACREH3_18285 [Geminicoccales bacterium]